MPQFPNLPNKEDDRLTEYVQESTRGHSGQADGQRAQGALATAVTRFQASQRFTCVPKARGVGTATSRVLLCMPKVPGETPQTLCCSVSSSCSRGLGAWAEPLLQGQHPQGASVSPQVL